MERREGNSAKSHNSQGQHNWSKEAINEGFSGHCSRELKSDLSQLSHVESKLSRGQVTPEGSKGYLHRILGDDPTTNLFVDWPLWESRDEISSEDLKNQGLEPQIDFKNLNGDYNDALDGPQAPSNDYSKHQRTGRNHRREKSPFHAEEERMKASLLSHSASDTDSYLNQSSSKDNIDPQNSMQKQSLQGTPLTIPSKEVQRKKRNLESIQNILRESSLRKKFGNILSSLKTIGQRRESGLTSQNDRLQNLNRKNHMPRELYSTNQESSRTRALLEPNFKKKVNSQVSITIGQILNLTVTPKHYFQTSRSNSKKANPSQTRMKTEEDNSRNEQNRARKESPIREMGNRQVSREKPLEHRDSTGLFSMLKILNNSVRQTSTIPEKYKSQEFSPGSHTSKLLEKIIKKSSRVNSKEAYRSTNSSTGRVQAGHLSQNLDEKSNSRIKRSGHLDKPQVSKKNRKIESLIGKMYTETATKWNISSQDLKRTQPQREQQKDSSKSRGKRQAGDSKANSKYSSYKSFDPLSIQLDKDSSPSKPLCRSREKSSSYARGSQHIPEPKFGRFAPAQYIDCSPAQRSHLESKPNNKETTNLPTEKVAKKSLEGESRGKSKSELEKINSRIKASKSEQAQLANLEVEVVLTKNRGLEPLSVTPNSVKTEDLKLPSQLSRGYESRSSKRGKQHYDALEPKECGSQMIGSNQPVHRHEQSTGNYSQNSRGLPQNILAGPKKSSESNLERTTSDQKGGFYTLLRGIQSTSEAKPISYTSSRK